MRKLLAAAACVLALNAPAQSPSFMQSVASSAVVSAGTWLLQNNVRVYRIEIESRGATFEDARLEGFRLAVDRAIGSLVLAESEMQNNRLIRKEVTNYASGYVDRFQIQERQENPGRVDLRMTVWVAHSAIANRLLAKSETAGVFDGSRASAQIETLLKERATGDAVVAQVLKDFPRRAFDVTLGVTALRFDAYRQALIEVPFTLKWNYNYITSLHEALQATAQNPQARNCWNYNHECSNQTYIRVVAQAPDRFTKWQNTLGYNDYQRHNQVHDAFIGSTPVMQLVIRDNSNRVVVKNCYSWTQLTWSDSRSFAETRNNQIGINGDLVRKSSIVLSMGQNIPALEALNNVELSVVKAKTCKA